MLEKTMPTIEDVRRKSLPVLERYRTRRASLFGSVVRGDASEDSDIDMLVEVDEDLTLLDIVRLNRELEEALGRKVDLVEYETLKPRIKKRILAEEVPIL